MRGPQRPSPLKDPESLSLSRPGTLPSLHFVEQSIPPWGGKGCAPLPPISTFHPSALYTELCVGKEGEILPASFAVAPLLGSQSSASVSSPDSSDPGKAERLKNHWGEDSRGELEVEKPVPPAAGSPLFPAFNHLRPRSILYPCGFSASSPPSVWLGSGPEPLCCPATLSSPALGLRVGLMEAATWELCLQ